MHPPQSSHGELASEIRTAITTNPHLLGRKLRFETAEGRVVLRGEVATYFQKQMAQEALRRIEGIHDIQNELHVAWT